MKHDSIPDIIVPFGYKGKEYTLRTTSPPLQDKSILYVVTVDPWDRPRPPFIQLTRTMNEEGRAIWGQNENHPLAVEPELIAALGYAIDCYYENLESH